jgi:hypothetical protein
LSSNEKNGKKVIPRSVYIKILVFLGLIGLSTVALRPIQTAIGDAITSVRTNLIERLEAYTGMEIRYSSIRPAFLTSLNIRNLKFYKDENEILTIPSARFYYSLRELLFRKKTVIHTIQIDRPVFRLDMDRDRNIFEHFKSMSNSKDSGSKNEILGQIAEFLPERADYRIRGGSFSITGGKALLQIENVSVNIRGNRGDILLDTKFGAEIRYTGLFDRVFTVSTGLGINGVYLAGLREGKAEIALSSLTFSQRNVKKRQSSFFWPASVESNAQETLFSTVPVAAVFSYKKGQASLTPSSENTCGGYYIRYDTQTRGILAEINCDGFIPGSLVNLPDHWKNAGLFNMATTGNLSLKYENGALDYSIYLQSGNLTRPQQNAYLSDAFLISAYGNNKYIAVDDFCLNISPDTARAGFFQGIVDFSGRAGFAPFRPAGTVSIDRFSLTGKEYASGVFDLSADGGDIRISGERLSIGSARLNNLDMRLFSSQRDLTVTVSSLCEDGGTVYLDAILNRNPGHIEASLFIDSFSVFNLTESFRPFTSFVNVPFSGEVYTRGTFLDAEIFFSSDFKNIVYNAPSITIKRDGLAGFFSFSGTDRHFTLSEGIFYLGDDELMVSANANFSNPMDINFSVNANYLDLSWNIKGDILDRTTLIIRDPNGLHAYGGISNSGVISGFIECVDFPLPASIRPMYTDFYITMRYNAADFWSVNVAHFKVRDLFSHNGTVNLGFSGAADQDGASFKDISYNDNKGSLSGSADFIWNTDFSFPHFIVSMTDGKSSGESYFLEGMFNNNNLDVNASVSGMRIDRFIKRSAPMTASAEAKVSWNSADSFNAQINLSSFYARARTNAVQASVDITLSNDEFVAHNLRFDYSGLRTVFPVFRLSPREGSARVSAEVQGFAASRRIEGKVNLSANFDQIDSWTDIMWAYNSFNGILQIEDIQYGDITKDSIVFNFSGDEKAISVSGGINDMLRMEMDRDGNFYASLSDPLPIRGAFAGTFEKGRFDAFCNDYFIDLASLWELTGGTNDNINIAGGYITGKMNLRGPVWNPEFSGTGRGTSLRLQVPEYVSEDIRPVPFDILAEGYEMTFGPVATVSGSGRGFVNGWFRFEYWIPRNIGLDINIPRQNPIPYNASIASFMASGDASGKLSLNANLNDKLLEIKGDLYMNNTEMGVSMDKINAASDETDNKSPFNTMAEISITAGPTVDFFWPSIKSPILRVNPEIGTVFSISYDSQAEQYSLVSDIRVRSGEIYYMDRYFYIRRGNLIFRENERQFNPIISARAEIRDRADSGPVTISMIIDSQPLLSFVPRFESSPGLTQLEIYTILSQNPNIQGNDNTDMTQRFLLASSTDLMAQFVAGSEVLSQLIFVRQFERRIRNFFNLDMLSIRTRFLQNAVASSGSTVLGQAPVDRIYRVGNYFDNTTVFIGKYVGQDMFVQSTLTMKYDENSQTFGGLRFQPDIGLELQSPFFNIRWSFFPYHPENWWVDDHSITLIWSKSF